MCSCKKVAFTEIATTMPSADRAELILLPTWANNGRSPQPSHLGLAAAVQRALVANCEARCRQRRCLASGQRLRSVQHLCSRPAPQQLQQ